MWPANGHSGCGFVPSGEEWTDEEKGEFLGLDGRVEEETWDFDALDQRIKAGGPLGKPEPLYTKLDPEIIDQEVQRLGAEAV